MIMVLGQISAIPEEVREAALLDGAKGWTLDRCIVLPLIKDTIKTSVFSPYPQDSCCIMKFIS